MPGPAVPVASQQVQATVPHTCQQCNGAIFPGEYCWAYNSKYWHYGGCPSSRSKDPAATGGNAGNGGSGQREDFAIFVQVGFQGWVRADRAEKLNKAWLEAFLEARK